MSSRLILWYHINIDLQYSLRAKKTSNLLYNRIMQSLVQQLQRDYPNLTFRPANCAHWSANEQTIYYNDDDLQTLHELGHALLNHRSYSQDITLLQMERAAWEKAQQLAPRYSLVIDDNTIEDALDSYRDWLHQRSKCPQCGQTGIQSASDLSYHCPNCQCVWRATDGRQTAMRRVKQ